MVSTMTAALAERAVGDWTAHLRAQGRSEGTIALYARYVTRMLTTLGMAPIEVSWADLETWLAAHQWKASTRKSAVTALHGFFSWLQESGLRTDDPARGLTAPRQPAPCPKPMPEATLAHGLDCSDGEVWWMLRLLATTGLRRAEAAKLHRDDVAGGWARVTGKGGRTRRVPVPPDVEAWIATRPGWVFPSPRSDGPITPDAIGKRCRRATGMSPHTLRHRYATQAYRATHDLRSVQRLLGHASVATTERYVAWNDDELVAAASVTWAA